MVEIVEQQKETIVEEPIVEPTKEPKVAPEILALIEKARLDAKKDAEETYKGIQRTIAKKDQEIARLRKQAEDRPSTTVNEAFLEALKADNAYGDNNPKIQQLEALLAQEKAKEAQSRAVADVEAYTNTWREKMEAKITEKGLDPEDEQFADVWEQFDLAHAIDGKFERADKKLDRVLKGVVVEKIEEPVKDDFEARLKEEKRKWMIEAGLLEKETGEPAGSGSKNVSKIINEYAESPNDPDKKAAYAEMMREKKRKP